MATAIFILSSPFPFSLLPKIRQSDEISDEPKGYTPVSNSRKFLYLGSRKA
jgi:hypothetical protein